MTHGGCIQSRDPFFLRISQYETRTSILRSRTATTFTKRIQEGKNRFTRYMTKTQYYTCIFGILLLPPPPNVFILSSIEGEPVSVLLHNSIYFSQTIPPPSLLTVHKTSIKKCFFHKSPPGGPLWKTRHDKLKNTCNQLFVKNSLNFK